LAFLFSLSSWCLASLSLCWFSSEGYFTHILKAWFLFSIRSMSIHSASENQSGLFLVLVLATLLAHCTTCFSRLFKSSDSGWCMAASNGSFSKNLFTFSWKFDNSMVLRRVLLIFVVVLMVSWWAFFFLSRGLDKRLNSIYTAAWSLCEPSNFLLTFLV
jgi:hypothetical protein